MEGTADPQTIPLALLVDAWGITAEAIISELGPDRVITDCLRIKHVRVTDACALLEQRDAREAQQRQQEDERRATMDALQRPVLARVQAIQAKQHAQRAAGDIDASTPALVAMTLGDPNNRLEAAGRRFDDMLNTGRAGHMGTMYRFNPEQEA